MDRLKLKDLFEPYDGVNVREWEGKFVVYVPWAGHDPIVVDTVILAEQIDEAISEAFSAGVRMG